MNAIGRISVFYSEGNPIIITQWLVFVNNPFLSQKYFLTLLA